MADHRTRIKEVLRPPRLESIALDGGEISGGLAWKVVAARLEEISDFLPKRMARRSLFDKALAEFVAREIAGVAAEIRVNLALEEQDACMRRCGRHG